MQIKLSATLALVALLFCVAGAARPVVGPTPGVGDEAPEFSLETPAGEQVVLSELVKEGPVVVVVLRGWPGYQCPICTRQVGDLMQSADAFAKEGAKVIMIYPGPAKDLDTHASEFIGNKQFPEHFRFVTDPAFSFTDTWGLRWDAPKETAYPSSFVIGENRIVHFAKVSKGHGDRASADELLSAVRKMKEAMKPKAEPDKMEGDR